jgi:hypothetical protein
LWSPNGLASSRQSDENRWQRKPKALRNGAQRPELTERKARTNLLKRSGLEAKKTSSRRKAVFS